MDQFSQNSERFRGGELFRLSDGIAHAETGPEVFR
jgi:hypothetical protein